MNDNLSIVDLQTLIDMDRELLYYVNGSNSLFLDGLMVTFTSILIWIPLYLSLLYIVVKNSETVSQIVLIVGATILCLLLAGGVDDLVVKPLVGRWRPSHDPIYQYTFDIVGNLRDTEYGFFSAHAANTFSIAIFFSLLIRHRVFSFFMVAWSLLNCYTRMYLGLHYPGDILCGLLWGGIVGVGCYLLYRHIYSRFSPQINYVSSHYTQSGYSHADINVVLTVFSSILCYAVLKAVYMAG